MASEAVLRAGLLDNVVSRAQSALDDGQEKLLLDRVVLNGLTRGTITESQLEDAILKVEENNPTIRGELDVTKGVIFFMQLSVG